MHGGQWLCRILSPGSGGALTARLVGLAKPLQPPVALPAVSPDGRARLDIVGDEGVE